MGFQSIGSKIGTRIDAVGQKAETVSILNELASSIDLSYTMLIESAQAVSQNTAAQLANELVIRELAEVAYSRLKSIMSYK